MELAPQLRRIGNDMIAAHIVLSDDGITLVDTGLPGHYRDLVRELRELERPISDIKGIVLTHGDSDHIGFAERLRSELGIPVYIGPEDADRAKGAKPPATPKDPRRVGPVIRFFAYAIAKGGFRTRPLREVIPVHDGDALPLPGSPRVVSMPGHSPGSIAVYVPTVRAVFVGDELTTRHVLTGASGPQPAPFTDDQKAASASIERLSGLDVDWVIPGHGAPWHGTASSLIAAYRSAEGRQAKS